MTPPAADHASVVRWAPRGARVPPAGFADLKRAVTGITDSMLSDRLTELASIGLVRRTVANGKPPTVTYVLTEEGARLLPVFEQLARWAHENLADARPATGPQRVRLS